jgi:hypothetical protein
VRREVAKRIVSPGFGQEETDCSVSRNLPVHAGLVTIWCEATGTT